MKVKVCVSNLDLFEKGSEDFYKQLQKKENAELEEIHCIGLCFLCQQTPTAVVRGVPVTAKVLCK